MKSIFKHIVLLTVVVLGIGCASAPQKIKAPGSSVTASGQDAQVSGDDSGEDTTNSTTGESATPESEQEISEPVITKPEATKKPARTVSLKLLEQIDMLIKKEQYDRASMVTEQVLKSYPKSPELWIRMAKVYAAQNQCVKAKSALARAGNHKKIKGC